MPGYPWLENAALDPASIAPRMNALRTIGVPYTQAEIDGAAALLKDKTELDALVAYLQGLGTALK
jgi:cytochrome c oxidase cbb3-type subunit 2